MGLCFERVDPKMRFAWENRARAKRKARGTSAASERRVRRRSESRNGVGCVPR